MKINQNGRSMIEMLGVLAIIGVLSAAGLIGYSKAMAKHKMNRTINQMVQIVNNIHTAFANSQSGTNPYTALVGEEGMRKAVALNIFPDEMIYDRNIPTILNLYKGKVSIQSEDGSDFEVVFEDLPKDVSIAIGTINWGIEDASGLQEIEINDGEEADDDIDN